MEQRSILRKRFQSTFQRMLTKKDCQKLLPGWSMKSGMNSSVMKESGMNALRIYLKYAIGLFPINKQISNSIFLKSSFLFYIHKKEKRLEENTILSIGGTLTFFSQRQSRILNLKSLRKRTLFLSSLF